MKTHSLLALLAAIALAGTAQAQIDGLSGQLIVENVPADFSFTVTNSENVSRDVFLGVFLPAKFVFLEKPGKLAPLETAEVKIRIFPEEELIGSTFSAKVTAEIGVSKAEKTFEIVFKRETSCPVKITTTLFEPSEENSNKFVLFSELENRKNSRQEFSIDKINGLPQGWVVETENSTLVNPLETRILKTTISPQSNFEGELEVVFDCGRFTETRTHPVRFDRQDPIGTGLVGLGGFFGDNNNSIILNVFLVAVAAFLMVMFISRLVRILVLKEAITSSKPTQVTIQEKTVQKTSTFGPSGNTRLEELKELVAEKKVTKK